MTLLLNNSEIAQLISMRECVEILEEGYRECGLGRAAHRRRSNILRAQSRQAFAREMEAKLGIEVRPVKTMKQAFTGSDIVCACTDSPRPFVKTSWLEPGIFLSSVRAHGLVPAGYFHLTVRILK